MVNKIRICKSCGVELEADMLHCPLCHEVMETSGNESKPLYHPQENSLYNGPNINRQQKKIIWEIISITLFSASTATVAIDLLMNNRITWSEYPAAISLTIFAYVSLFTFWHNKTMIQMTGSFILSSLFIIIIDALASSMNWSLSLGIPMLLSANIITIAMIIAVRMSKHKGINLIAYGFLGAMLLCLCIDGIMSYHETTAIEISWSVIVSGSIMPVIFVLFFMHFRLKKGRDLRKTFHI